MRCTHGVHACAHACAATYATNAADTNACPAGSSKITTEATCAAAAAFLGRTYSGFVSSPLFPSGCYLDTTAAPVAFVRLNKDPTGSAASVAQPLCRVIGAPPPCTPQGYRGRRTLWSSTAVVAQGHASNLRVLVRAPASTECRIQCPASAYPIPLGRRERARESS